MLAAASDTAGVPKKVASTGAGRTEGTGAGIVAAGIGAAAGAVGTGAGGELRPCAAEEREIGSECVVENNAAVSATGEDEGAKSLACMREGDPDENVGGWVRMF